MIVETMNYEDIIKTIENDVEKELHRRIFGISTDKKYRKFILKNNITGEYKFKPVKLVTKDKNVYFIRPWTKGKSDFRKYGLLYTFYMIYHLKDGYHACMICNSNMLIRRKESSFAFFTPHVFKRYCERFKKTNDITVDMIHRFIDDNSTITSQPFIKKKYKEIGRYGYSHNGVFIGSRINDRAIEFRTFITKDMLRENQIEEDNLTKLLDFVEENH